MPKKTGQAKKPGQPKKKQDDFKDPDDHGSKKPLILIIVIIIVAALAVGGFVVIKTGLLDSILPGSRTEEVEEDEDDKEEEETEEEEDEDDRSSADDELSAEEESEEDAEESKSDYELEITASSVTLTAAGEMKKISVDTNLEEDAELVWESSDETVATVDDSGYVTAVASGTATITVSCENLSDEIEVTCEIEEENDDYIIPDSDTRYLTEEDLEDLSEEEIRIARNEIYARHGRKFKDDELQAYFDSKSWYNGTIEGTDFDKNVTGYLNDYEYENTQFIAEYEEKMGYNQ
ncbi:MAG: YARHG domain-containing protein [Clostridiales bacterium]|nr:YARHG domain-containing protein [Clostridiales bacterium]